jgi:hypothetical protein
VLAVASLAAACGLVLLICAIAGTNRVVRGLATAAAGLPGGALAAYIASDASWPGSLRVAAAILTGGCVVAVILSSLLQPTRWSLGIAGGLVAAPWAGSALEAMFHRGQPYDSFFADSLGNTIQLLVYAAVGAFVWQVLEGVRVAVSELGVGAMHIVSRRHRWFVVFIAINVAWLGAGLFDILPGGASEWGAMRHAGWLWPWAFAIAGLLLALERTELVRADTRRVGLAVILTGGAWMLPTFVSALLRAAAKASSGGDSSGRLARYAGTFLQHTPGWRAIVVVTAVPAGLVLLRDPRRRALGFFLAIFGLWNLPVAWSLARGGTPPGSLPGSLLVLDAAIVTLVAVLGLIRLVQGRPQDRGQMMLLVVFAGLGAAAPASSIAQSVSGHGVFYLGLIAAPLWTFLFDAEDLNLANGGSSRRVYALVGVSAVTLALSLFDVSLGILTPSAGSLVDSNLRLVLVAPCAAVIALAAGTAVRRASRELDEGLRRPARREPRLHDARRPERGATR